MEQYEILRNVSSDVASHLPLLNILDIMHACSLYKFVALCVCVLVRVTSMDHLYVSYLSNCILTHISEFNVTFSQTNQRYLQKHLYTRIYIRHIYIYIYAYEYASVCMYALCVFI